MQLKSQGNYTLFEKHLKDGVSDLDNLYKTLMTDLPYVNDISIKDLNQTINQIARVYTNDFVRLLPEQMKIEISKKLKIEVDELAAFIESGKLEKYTLFDKVNKQIILTGDTLNLNRILKSLALHHVKRTNDQLSGNLTALFKTTASDAFMNATKMDLTISNRTIELLSSEIFSGIEGVAMSKLKNQLFDETMSGLSEQVRQSVIKSMAEFRVGMAFVAETKESAPIIENLNVPETPSPANVGDQVANMALRAGLSYYAPALVGALSILDQWNQLKLLISRQNRLVKEYQNLLLEQMHLEKQQTQGLVNIAIAKAEEEVSILMKKAHNDQLKVYSSMIENKLTAMTENRAKVSLRIGLYYYLTEQVQSDLFTLNKALNLWYNTSIKDLVTSDPQNIRYALDSDILLFDWLNTSIESERANLDSLSVHWTRIKSLIRNNCPMCISGGKITLVQQTPSIKLSSLISEVKWKQFKDWQRSGSPQPFEFSISIHPGLELVNVDHNNVRIVSTRMGGVEKRGDQLVPVPLTNQFTLTHSGVSYLKHDNTFRQDILTLTNSASISDGYTNDHPSVVGNDNWPGRYDINELQVRWSQAGGAAIRPFEGYGIYTVWKLKLNPVRDNRKLEDIYLRFAYQYMDGSEDQMSIPYLAQITTQSGTLLNLESNILSPFGTPAEVEAFFRKKTRETVVTVKSFELKLNQ